MPIPERVIFVPRSHGKGSDKIHTNRVFIDLRCFISKKYPTCACGKKYVPLKVNPTKCIFCIYADPTQQDSNKTI